MASGYLRRLEALEAVLGDGVCPEKGCEKCQLLEALAAHRGIPFLGCDGRPGSLADGLREFDYLERQALRAAIDTELKRRNEAATTMADVPIRKYD